VNALRLTALTSALICGMAACSNDGGTAPKQQTAASTATGTQGAVFSTPSDTTPVASGPAALHGSVILITVTSGAGQPADTSHTSPISGARLSLSQRVNSGGSVTLVPYAQTTTNASGAFSFGSVPSGYYVLKAEGPEGASYKPAEAYVVTSVNDIDVQFRLVTGM